MIITMIPMGMMKMIANEIVDVVYMGHRFMSATGPVHVTRFMFFAPVSRCASGGIGVRYFK
jgi:hypothetical protein